MARTSPDTSPAKRRPRGSGGVYQRPNGTWVGMVDAGFTDDGKRRRKSVTGRTETEATRKLQKARDDYARAGRAPQGAVTVEKWLNEWLGIIDVRPSTKKSYESTVRLYLIPLIGRHRLDRLERRHIRAMYDTIPSRRRKGDLTTELSPHTVSRVHRVLRAALRDARSEGLVVYNVLDGFKGPSTVNTPEKKALTAHQARRLIEAVATDPMCARWVLALTLGARQGEVLGLQADRVDLTRGTVDLAWQLQRLPARHGCGGTCGMKRSGNCPQRVLDVPRGFEYVVVDGLFALTRPKTDTSRRVVPLPPLAYHALATYPYPPGMAGLVFTRPDGRPIDYSDDNAAWHAALDKAGLPSVPLHGARHTTGTLLREFGVDLDTIRAIMGHSSAAVTTNYLHADLDHMRRSLAGLDAALSAAAEPSVGVTVVEGGR